MPSVFASVLHLDRGTVSTSLRRLERKGLVTMRRDPRDGRRIALGLTTLGRALDRSTPLTVERAVEQLLGQLGSSQVASVKGSLCLLAATLTSAMPDVLTGATAARRPRWTTARTSTLAKLRC